jgi:hypothetical protein
MLEVNRNLTRLLFPRSIWAVSLFCLDMNDTVLHFSQIMIMLKRTDHVHRGVIEYPLPRA